MPEFLLHPLPHGTLLLPRHRWRSIATLLIMIVIVKCLAGWLSGDGDSGSGGRGGGGDGEGSGGDFDPSALLLAAGKAAESLPAG